MKTNRINFFISRHTHLSASGSSHFIALLLDKRKPLRNHDSIAYILSQNTEYTRKTTEVKEESMKKNTAY